MKYSTSNGLARAFGLVPGLVVVATAGSLLLLNGTREPHVLQAVEGLPTPDDFDGDGLSDLQERVLLTDPNNWDTDGDGYSDAEELARKSSPLVPSELPLFGRMKMGSTMLGGQELHLLLAVYLPNQDFSGSDLRLGVQTPNRAAELSYDQVSAMANVKLLSASLGTATIVMIDLPINSALVPYAGDLNLYATVGTAGSGRVASSTVARLRRVDGRIVYCMPIPELPTDMGSLLPDANMGGGSGGGSGGSSGGGPSSPPTPGGSLFHPLQLFGDSAVPWSPGMICYQNSSPVGVLGASVTYEVTQSDCMDNWDAICPPSCSTSVGSTYTEVDPLGLMGG